MSYRKISILTKDVGLKRKRLKKKPNTVFKPAYLEKRALYAAEILNIRHKQIVFLDESGFNLHVSNNYGYSMPNEDAILSVCPSRGRNISLCAIFSVTGIIDYKIIESSFNGNSFNEFILNSFNNMTLTRDMVIIMDNATIHHKNIIKDNLSTNGIGLIYLPPYSPDFNPIENVFSVLKSKISSRRPVASNREELIRYLTQSIEEFNSNSPEIFLNFYRKMWETLNKTLNE